jgi:hypothetical protein
MRTRVFTSGVYTRRGFEGSIPPLVFFSSSLNGPAFLWVYRTIDINTDEVFDELNLILYYNYK